MSIKALKLYPAAFKDVKGLSSITDADGTKNLKKYIQLVIQDSESYDPVFDDITADSISVGPNGTTTPVFSVTSGSSTTVTGLNITGGASGSLVALTATDSGSNTALSLNAKGTGAIAIGNGSTGLISVGRGSTKQLIKSGTVTAIGAAQNSTPTAAQLLGGIITQQSQTGAGTITLPSGTSMDAAISGATNGDNFEVFFANIGSQTLTLTAATGFTVVGTATVSANTNFTFRCVKTGSGTWVAYTNK